VALIVETGAGDASANSYASVADADAYFADRNDATWTGTNSVKEAALIIATAYIDSRYRARWQGYQTSSGQALSWPRIDVYKEEYICIPPNTIPKELKNATIELAKRALTNQLMPDIAAGAASIIKKKVGPIEIDYAVGQVPSKIWSYPEMILSPLFSGSGISIRMERS
jgi:hypothetical protein